MEALPKWLSHLLSLYYLSITIILLKFIPNIFKTSLLVSLMDSMINLYYRFYGLRSFLVNIDDQTAMNFWVPIHPNLHKPNLVLIHGYGSESKWQMSFQIGQLANLFNLYTPDLLFFGKSYTSRTDRSEVFQAKCVLQGMKKLGVTRRYSVFGISYGGFVTYRMADMKPDVLDKIVIASSGIGCTEEQKTEHLGKLGRSVPDLLLPQNPDDLRLLISMAFSKSDPLKWVPDFVLQQLLNVLGGSNRKEKMELVEHLLSNGGSSISNINVDTLLLWGDKDNIFPLTFAYQLQRQLGPKAKLEILKDTGHASNLESPTQVNQSILHFALSGDTCNGKHM